MQTFTIARGRFAFVALPAAPIGLRLPPEETASLTHRPSFRPLSPAIQRAQALQCAGTPGSWRCPTNQSSNYEGVMSKGMDQKKSQKKEPAKTLKEKRAAKQEKKAK
ncbi:hypothetical protein FHY35_003326 [Xanthomonas arboricola]|nr:hypothetical protein [Xanthomonas arboricola]NIJ86282.1 hypothetical protein [Xanthomonas arboricola]